MGLFDFLKGKQAMPEASARPVPDRLRPKVKESPEYRRGTKLGDRYVIRDVLGRGGFGVVYSALNQETGEPVAIKALRVAGNEGQIDDFEAELKIWMGLGTHPFIVTLHHVLYHNGRLHAVMEHVAPSSEGMVSLFDIIERSAALNDQRIGDYCIQFCTAMKYAAEKGMRAHRDIKPMNLLVDAGAMLKICDFGLAWAVEKLGDAVQLSHTQYQAQRLISLDGNVTCGTPGFIAPELFQGASASSASDMFSFGVTLWQLASRCTEMPYTVPFRGDMQQFQRALFDAQRSRNWRTIPSIYWPIIERCLQPDPVQRYRNYDQLLTDIKQVMNTHGLRTLDYLVAKEGYMHLADLVNHGASLSLMGNHLEALRRLTEALRIDPTLAAAWINRGNVYSRMGEHCKALADHQKALDLEPQLPEARLVRADDYIALGQYRRALHDVQAFRQLRPNSIIGLCLNAEVLAYLDQADEGIRLVDQAEKLEPNNPRVHHALGELNLAKGDIDCAITWLGKALTGRPDSIKSQVALLRALYRKKDLARLQAQVAIALELYADDTASLNTVGVTLAEIGLLEIAITAFQPALKIAASSRERAVVLTNLGVAHGDSGQLQRAIEYLEMALTQDPEYFLAQLSKSRFLYDTGDFEAAEPSYARAYELEKHSVTALMGLSASALANKKAALASDALEKLLALEPNNLQARYNLAIAQQIKGDIQQAAETLTKVLAIDETYAHAWYAKAIILRALGRNLDAWNASVQACKHIKQLSKHEAESALKLMHELTDAPM